MNKWYVTTKLGLPENYLLLSDGGDNTFIFLKEIAIKLVDILNSKEQSSAEISNPLTRISGE